VYDWSGVIPGMALHLKCSSTCLPHGATGITWSLLSNHTTPDSIVFPLNKPGSSKYLSSADNGLVILNVNATEDVGTFQCQYKGHVLTQHRISLSGIVVSQYCVFFFLNSVPVTKVVVKKTEIKTPLMQ